MPSLSRRQRLRRALELPAAPRTMSSVSFGSSIPREAQNISGPEHDPAAWRADFDQWRAEKCIHGVGRDDSGSIKLLWNDFIDWTLARESVPCVRPTFERLLTDAGFQLKDGMVLELLLREEFESVRDFRPWSPDHGAPARAHAEKRVQSAAPAMAATRMPNAIGSQVRKSIVPPAVAADFAFEPTERPPMPAGVRLIRWEPKDAPVRLSEYASVETDVPKFIATTLRELDNHLRGKTWLSGNWGLSGLLARLAARGCIVALEDAGKALQ